VSGLRRSKPARRVLAKRPPSWEVERHTAIIA